MVDEVRNKWCEDLEDLVQCPVCFERPQNAIYQCVEGHHVCQVCKPQLRLCPTCAKPWTASRNRFAEHLCSKLDEMKISLIDPENEINKLLIAEKVSVSTQTDETVSPELAVKKTPFEAQHNKTYPCQINCTFQASYDLLLKHLITDHTEKFSELSSNGAVFEHSWTFQWTQDMIFDRAFLVARMGAFFLKLSTDMFGNFTGYVQMIHGGHIAKNFTYQLEVSCCTEHKCSIYTGEMCSCRTPAAVFRDKSLRINRQEIIKMMEHKDELTCTLLLGKKAVSLTPEPAARAKNRPGKPRNQGRNNELPNNQLHGSVKNLANYNPIFNRK